MLRERASQVHLRLDESLGLLKIDLLGGHSWGNCILLLHLEDMIDLLVSAYRLPARDIDRVSGVVRRRLIGAAPAEEALLLPPPQAF